VSHGDGQAGASTGSAPGATHAGGAVDLPAPADGHGH
jgi:hypothetical protein